MTVAEIKKELKGEGCCICGYDKCLGALEFHHLHDKEADIGACTNVVEFQREVNRCILVCANCHREIHAGLIEAPKEAVIKYEYSFELHRHHADIHGHRCACGAHIWQKKYDKCLSCREDERRAEKVRRLQERGAWA